MISLGIESSYYSEDEGEIKEDKKLNKNKKIKLKKELKELFDYFEEEKNE